jgi:stearoyl-CoA desaturase (delta-9 desaturase)
VTHHCTFFINSLCHLWGDQPYGDKTTARDNFVLAFLTYGEGYHNFHHRFEADYRNGIRWYHWDPTKWLIRTSAFLGLTRNLRKVSEAEILKARLAADEQKLMRFGQYNPRFQEIRKKIEESQNKVLQFKKRYQDIKKDFSEQRDVRIEELKVELRLARIELEAALKQWQLMCQRSLQNAMQAGV